MKGKAQGLWSKYRDTHAIKRAEDFAKYTVPYLMVDPLERTDQQSSGTIERDYQSVGALLVNNLSSKIASALFPVGIPYFKLRPSPELVKLARERGVDEQSLVSSLSRLEREAAPQVFHAGGLHALTYMIKLLIVTGMCLTLRDTERYQFTVWNLHSFAVRRDGYGVVRDVVLKQRVLYEDAEPDVRAALATAKARTYTDGMYIDVYTHIAYKQGELNRYAEIQREVDGEPVGKPSVYPEHLCPWQVLSWNVIVGENYARGLVEDYAGDFARLSMTSEALGIYEQESLDVLRIVDEQAGSAVSDFKEAETGDYIAGRKDSVYAFEVGDYNKIATLNNSIVGIIQRLSQAFMYTGQMRDAERVTAAEVRNLVREVETTFGGVYSLLAHTMQAPFAYLSMYEVRDTHKGVLAGLISKSYRPSIFTGAAALQRSSEMQALVNATQEVAAIVPVLAQSSQRIDIDKVFEKIMLANNVDLESISKTPEELRAMAAANSGAAAGLEATQEVLAAGPEIQQSIQGIQQ